MIETDASPSGFETLYYDSEDHQVLDPSSLQTDESTSQKIVNRELLDVPVEKHWADFGGEAYTWEVVFQLDRALMDVEHPVAEEDLVFEPVEGKYLTMSKGDETPKFEDLPMYCVDENGKIYRIHYSVVEKSYTVWRGAKTNENIVARWVDGDSTATIPEGVQYTPQFEQDAGEHGAAVDDYKIIIINNLQDLHLARETNLTVEKTWPAGTDYANSNTASATFELHRYVHEEHRDYRPYMVENWQWVDITIDTGNGNPQTIHVPSGYPLHLVGRMKSGQSAGTLAFTQTIGEGDPTTFGEYQTTFDSNTGTFDLSFTADQTKTITLTSGSGSILGGADGIRLAAYNSKGTDTVDQNFVETFTLNKDEGWSTFFDDLPLVQEEKNVNPAIASQTIYVYSYYLVETNKTPVNSQATYTCDGEAVQSESGRYDLAGTQTLTAANTILGDLDITKTVQKNGTKDGSANGTFWYAVYDSEYDPNADPPQTPVREGSITVVDGEGEVTEQDLPVGTYYVYELTGENGTPIVSGNNGTHKSINDTIYNVTGSGTTSSVRDSSGDTESDTAALVNNRQTTNKTGTKTWVDLKANTVHPTIYFRLFYRTSTGDIAVSGAEQKTLENGTTSVEWTDVPKYDENGGEYVYVVKEYVKNDHGDYIEAAPNGYISSEDGLNVTNTQSEKYEPTTGYSGRKIWADTANGGATRPSAINVTLMVDKTGDGQSSDDEVAKDINGGDCIVSWPVDTGDVWEYSFGNLPVFDSSGNAIKYYAVEEPVEGYTPQSDITATQYSYLQPDTTQYDSNGGNVQVVNLTPSGNAAHIINDANISLNAEISHLPYVAVKINAYNRNYHIWTARQLSQGEKTELISVFNQALGTSEANLNNTRFVDGLPVSKAADGNVEFLYRENVPRGSGYKINISKQGDETLKVQVDNHGAFDYILVGTLAYSYDEGKTDFTNTLKTEDYDVQKTWGAGKSAPEGTEVVITLKGTIPGEANDQNPNPDPVQVDLSAVGVSKTTATLNGGLEGGDDTTANPWIYSWQGLPQYDTAGNRITYSAEETSYKIDGVAVDLNTYVPVSSSDTTYELVVTNQIPTASFDIVKVAKGTSTRLSGATFTIRQVNKNSKTAQITYKDGSTESQPVTTGDDGKVSFTDVAIGYYEVKEKQQPAGYIIENDGDDTFYIKVDPEGVKLLKKVVEDGKLSLVEADGLVVNNVTVTSDGSSLEFIMENTPGAALPYTGGPGTNMLYFFGIMLTGLAGAGLVMKRRRRNVT